MNTPDFSDSEHDQLLTLVYAPLQVVCYVIELMMVCFFYRTGMRFAKILQQETTTKAKLLFGSISVVMVAGRWDLYIN